MTYKRQRAHIGIEEEKRIADYALSPLYRDMTRADLAKKIQTEIAWSGKEPELEVLVKKITYYRNTCVWREDEPWSLGESSKPEYDIPADANSILLELWRYSLEIGYPLTLRHAKWIARLHKVIVTADNETDHWKQIQVLFFTALQYADLERVSQALNQPQFDTRDKDADLIMSRDETMALETFGLLPFPHIFSIPKTEEKFEKRMGIKRSVVENLCEMIRTGDFNVVMIVHDLHRPRSLDELPHPKDNKESAKFFRSCVAIEEKVAGLSIEQQRAYATLVTCFSKGPKWNELFPIHFLQIIAKFAELVSQQSRLSLILSRVALDEGHALAPYFKIVGLTPILDIEMDVEAIFNLYGSHWKKDELGVLAPIVSTKDSEVKHERKHKTKRQK